MILYSPPEMLRAIEQPGHMLRGRRDLFISRQAGYRFEGYLKRQRERITGELSQRTNRPELVERYGFDTKFAYHALRLAMQGIELMQEGYITLPMPANARGYLVDVRTGKYGKDEVLDHLDSLTADLQRATEKSEWLERADFDRLSRWVAEMHQEWWSRK